MKKVFTAKTTALVATIMTASTVFATAVSADEIVLTPVDGTFSLEGEYLGFQHNAYIIDYNGEKLYVPIAMMVCEGVHCLKFTPAQADSEDARS